MEQTKGFIDKATRVHGDKYDYSKTHYIKSSKKVIIICKIHGPFTQTPSKHLSKRGCITCGGRKKLNTEEFIIKAKEIHGDVYDYSKVNYINNQTNVVIICKTHGPFEQIPSSHVSQGSRCSACSGRKKLNTESFIVKAKEIHGDVYDYSKVVYINAHTNIVIICKSHGSFEQTPTGHLRGSGCRTCGHETTGKLRRLNTERFIVKAQKIHGDMYDYSKVDYVKSNENVIIICKKHGEFEQQPLNHLMKRGCVDCGRERTGKINSSTQDEFITKAKEIHGDAYDYSKVRYVNSNAHVDITCKIHGDFRQSPSHHLMKKGCRTCGCERTGKHKLSNTKDFIDKAINVHKDLYDYSNVKYVKSQENVIIICKKHGPFEQQPNNHLSGANCPMCKNKTEQKLYEALKPLYPTLITQFKQEWCKNINYLPFDFCIHEHNIIIELDGRQHFTQVSNWNSPEETLENDLFKEKCANDNGYSIIRILQKDVFGDKYDWLSKVQTEIENIIKDNTIIHNIYICNNGEYDNFIIE